MQEERRGEGAEEQEKKTKSLPQCSATNGPRQCEECKPASRLIFFLEQEKKTPSAQPSAPPPCIVEKNKKMKNKKRGGRKDEQGRR